jgi:hypothetical protein
VRATPHMHFPLQHHGMVKSQAPVKRVSSRRETQSVPELNEWMVWSWQAGGAPSEYSLFLVVKLDPAQRQLAELTAENSMSDKSMKPLQALLAREYGVEFRVRPRPT